MITIQDLYNIVGNKIANEAQKALIRNNFPPQIRTAFQDAIEKWCPNEDIWIKRASTISCLRTKSVN